MKFQVFNAYLKMADEGRAPILTCGNDRDHARPFVGIDKDDEPMLWCVECDWKQSPGVGEYESMKRCLSIDDVRWLDIDKEDYDG